MFSKKFIFFFQEACPSSLFEWWAFMLLSSLALLAISPPPCSVALLLLLSTCAAHPLNNGIWHWEGKLAIEAPRFLKNQTVLDLQPVTTVGPCWGLAGSCVSSLGTSKCLWSSFLVEHENVSFWRKDEQSLISLPRKWCHHVATLFSLFPVQEGSCTKSLLPLHFKERSLQCCLMILSFAKVNGLQLAGAQELTPL